MFEGVGIDPLRAGGERHDGDAAPPADRGPARIDEGSGTDRVARIEDRTGDRVQRGLCAAGDEHIVLTCLDTGCGQPLRPDKPIFWRAARRLILEAVRRRRSMQDILQGRREEAREGAVRGDGRQVHARVEGRHLAGESARRSFAHEAAAPPVGVDQALSTRFGIGTGHGAGVDPQCIGQIAVGRQAVARHQPALFEISTDSGADRQIKRPFDVADVGQPFL